MFNHKTRYSSRIIQLFGCSIRLPSNCEPKGWARNIGYLQVCSCIFTEAPPPPPPPPPSSSTTFYFSKMLPKRSKDTDKNMATNTWTTTTYRDGHTNIGLDYRRQHACRYSMRWIKQEAQLMLTTGSTRLAVSRGQQTWYHSTCNIWFPIVQ